MSDARPTILPTLPLGEDSHPSRRTGYGLSPEMLVQARDRLGRLALIMAGMSVATILIVGGILGYIERVLAAHTISVVMALTLRSVARNERLSSRFALAWGLGTLFAYGVLLSVYVARQDFLATGLFSDPMWTCILIVTVPLVVPMPPRGLLIGLVATALTVPFGVLVIDLTTWWDGTWVDYFGYSISPAFCVIIAWLGSRFVYGISLDVTRARELGAYRLDEPLGQGGMGQVWKASHQLLARPAAVKVIRSEVLDRFGVAGDKLLARFEREAQVTASLCSPHTINLFDFGTTVDGGFYYVMELLEGMDFEQLVDRHGALPPERVVYLLTQACHSLQEAHERGLVHRDIKPGNLFVGRYGIDADFVKVLDFGLVITEATEEDEGGHLTAEGQIPGTPAYLPPEMIADAHNVDARTDLYALGCVAYWLLTARLVFDVDKPMQFVVAHLNDIPEPPSRFAEVDIPDELDALVMQCLAKQPTERPASAAALVKALEDIPFARPWTRVRAAQWWDLHEPGSNPTHR